MANIIQKIEKITHGFTNKATQIPTIKEKDLKCKYYHGKPAYYIVKKNANLIWYRSAVTSNNLYFDIESGITWMARVHI